MLLYHIIEKMSIEKALDFFLTMMYNKDAGVILRGD